MSLEYIGHTRIPHDSVSEPAIGVHVGCVSLDGGKVPDQIAIQFDSEHGNSLHVLMASPSEVNELIRQLEFSRNTIWPHQTTKQQRP
jgi:hypothetical protein